jgi:hypothetical protein
MIESDYIMRMITQLVQALTRILRLNDAKEYPQSLLEIEKAGKFLVGVDREMTRLFSGEQLMELFGRDLSVAVPKAYVLGVLLKEEGEIRFLLGEEDAALLVLSKSLYLLLATYLDGDGPVEESHAKEISRILDLVRQFRLGVKLEGLLVRYFEKRGEFAEGENHLFELVTQDPGHVVMGREFYQRLLALSDAQLEAGGLPRAEVESGARELEKLSQETMERRD